MVFGTLVLLTSTAPWRPAPQADTEPSTPDAAKVPIEATTSIDEAVGDVPLASDQADTPEETGGPGPVWNEGQAESEAPVPAAAPELPLPTGDELAAIGMSVEPAIAPVATPSEPAVPIASDKSAIATDEIAAMAATLPPRPIASEKSDAATVQVATALAATPPASQAPLAGDAGQVATVAATEVMTPPPPLPRHKPVQPLAEQEVAVLPNKPQPVQPHAKQEVAVFPNKPQPLQS